MKTIMFFELTDVGVYRFPRSIAHEIEKQTSEEVFYLFVFYENLNAEIKDLPANSKVIYLKDLSNKSLESIVKEYAPSKLVVMAQRIPDIFVISFFNNKGIPTYLMQHGLLIPFMKRTVGMFFSKIIKTLKYLGRAQQLAKLQNISSFKVIKEFILIFVLGKKKLAQSFLVNYQANANKVYVYGNYWKNYFKETYGYNEDQQIIIGAPDLMLLNSVLKEKKEEKSIGYICQTLIEDGRLKKSDFDDFVNKLNKYLPDDVTLYLKLHPRTNLDNFRVLIDRKNVITTKGFPNCDKYIGHYSSMLALSAHCSKKILLWDFEGHEIPKYISDLALVQTSDENDIKGFINGEFDDQEGKEKDINDAFFYDGTSPIQKLAQDMLNDI